MYIGTVLSLKMEYADGVRSAKAAAGKVAEVIRQHRKNLATIRADKNLSGQGQMNLERAARVAAAGELDQVFAEAHKGIAHAEEAIAEVLKQPDNDLNAEIKEQRAWDRYKRLLDAGKEPAAVIESAASDPVALRALRVELPAYIEAGHAGGHQDLQNGLRAAEIALDRAEAPYLSDLEQKAHELKRELEAGKYRLTIVENTVRAEAEGRSDAYALPNWPGSKDGEVVNLIA